MMRAGMVRKKDELNRDKTGEAVEMNQEVRFRRRGNALNLNERFQREDGWWARKGDNRKFFNSTLQFTSPLHSLLPPPRDQLPITRLRAASKFPRIPTRTKKYQSFRSYALAHYRT